jgi:hypothetical protein
VGQAVRRDPADAGHRSRRARRPLHARGARATTAVDFFDAEIERYPDHLGRTVLWVGASVLYGAREHAEQDIREIIVGSWL